MAAGTVLPVCAQGMVAYATEALVISTTALPITATLVTQSPTTNLALDIKRAARAALITVETNSVRFLVDGTTPTASVGHLIAAGDFLWLEGHDTIKNFLVIRASADAAATVTLFR